MKYIPSVLMLVVGVLMAFVYPLALDKMYGELVTQKIILKNNSWFFGNQTFINRQKNKVILQELHLTPSMNPVRISFPARYIKDMYASTDKYSRFRASLKMKNNLVWSKSLYAKQPKDSKDKKKAKQDRKHRGKKASLGSKLFYVETAGQYILEFYPERQQDLEVTNIDLKVKRNIAIPNKWFVGVGIVVLVAGFGLFARARKL